jgi:UDP-N-acetylmuramoylalanine-D-glutamate ligase
MSTITPSRALVVGLGVSGVAAATLLVSQGWAVTANDRATPSDLAARLATLPAGVAVATDGHSLELLDWVALVVASPGVPWELPLLAEARRRGIEVISEVELASRALPRVPIVGVTGSNGKTTVTSLLGAIGAAAGLRVGVGGNIGTAASELALAGGWDAVILELSSFPLEGCTTLRPRVGVLLNVSPDHLDRHPTMASYLAAKARVFAHQLADDCAVLNADDPALAGLQVPSRVFLPLDAGADAHLAGDSWCSGEPLLQRASCLLGITTRQRPAAALQPADWGSRGDRTRRNATALRTATSSWPRRAGALGGRLRITSGYRRGTCRLRPGTIHLILGGSARTGSGSCVPRRGPARSHLPDR